MREEKGGYKTTLKGLGTAHFTVRKSVFIG